MKHSIANLFHILMGDIRTLVRQEVLLIKTEMSEKISRVRVHALALMTGSLAVYAGLIALLLGFGLLLAWAFAIVGLPALLAGFIGLALIGLLVCGGGGWLAFKAIHALSKESLVPEKSLQALEHLAQVRSDSPAPETHPASHQHASESQPESKLSSEELEKAAFATEQALDQTFNELTNRFSPRHIAQRVTRRVVQHPVRIGATGLCLVAGLIGTLLLRRRRQRA